MDDAELNKVLDNVAKYVKNTPMGLQNFKNNKKFEHALARITDTVKMTGGGGGTVTATYLPACEEDEDLRKHFLRHRSIVLLKVGKEDAARAIVAPSPTEFHSILCCYGAEHRPVVLRLLLEEFVLKSRKCHAMLSAFLLAFFAVLFSEDRDDFKRLLAELWSVESVRELLKAGYKWSKPSEYLETATIDMPEYEGELPPGWQDSVLPSLGVFPQAGPAEEGIEEAVDVEMAARPEDSDEVADFEMAANLEDSGVDEAVEAHVAEDATMEAVAEAAVKDETAGDEFYDALDLPLDDTFDVKDFLNGEYAAGDRAGPSNVPLVSPRINNQLGRQRGVPVKEDYKDETKVPRACHDFSTRGVSGFVMPAQRLDAAPRIADNCRPRKRPPKKRDLLSSAGPSVKSPRFDGSSDMAAHSTSMTAQVQPSQTVKERRHKVLEGRLEDKRLTDVSGIDKRTAKSLEHKVWTVESLFAQFLVLKKNRQAFLDFLAAEVPLSPEDAVSCYECLRDYTAAHV